MCRRHVNVHLLHKSASDPTIDSLQRSFPAMDLDLISSNKRHCKCYTSTSVLKYLYRPFAQAAKMPKNSRENQLLKNLFDTLSTYPSLYL